MKTLSKEEISGKWEVVTGYRIDDDFLSSILAAIKASDFGTMGFYSASKDPVVISVSWENRPGGIYLNVSVA